MSNEIIISIPNEEDVQSLFEESINSLCKLNDPIHIIESHSAYEKLNTLFSISASYFGYIIKNQAKIVLESNIFDVLSKLLVHIYKKIEQINFDEAKPFVTGFRSYIKTNENERYLFDMILSITFMNRLLPISTDLCRSMNEKTRLESLLNFITNQEFIKSLLRYYPDCIGSIIFDINWSSKVADSHKIIWHQINAIKVLTEFTKIVDKWNLYVHMIIANVAFDNEIESLSEVNESIDNFVQLACECINDPDFITKKYEFFDDENNTQHSFDVKVIEVNNVLITLTGLLLSLFRLSINDKIKWAIYTKPNFKDALIKLIDIGIDVEIQYGMQVLVQLCFDEKVRDDLANDDKFLDKIKHLLLEKKGYVEYKKLIKTCEQLIWQLSEHKRKIEEDKQQSDKHIMISYNTESRSLCLKIKEYLEKINFKVWIDIDEIHGSSLDSMAKAVENAMCVLICVTEKYRQSNNCQHEAQYAFRLKKKIIPLIMQKGYHTVEGWLGFIIGDKIFVDLTKYSLDDSLQRIKSQIELNINNKREETIQKQEPVLTTISTPLVSITETPSLDRPIDWTNDRVEKWFIEKNLLDIHNELKPINGKVLNQLNQLQKFTPEFFYKSITKNHQLNAISVANFANFLQELFDN